MNLDEVLKQANWTEESIVKIYHGFDNCCRCGCGGRYFDRGTPGFNRALNKIRSDKFVVRPKGEVHNAPRHEGKVVCEGLMIDGNYINIPEQGTNDKCYCLYNG